MIIPRLLAPNAKLRPLVVPNGPPFQEAPAAETALAAECEVDTLQARPNRISWALAAALDWPVERVTASLAMALSTEWDDDGNVVGYGLTLRETAHGLEIDGRRLYAWCAFDMLFFPALIDRTVCVASRCAATGTAVSLTVNPVAIHELEPAGAAISLVVPRDTADIRRAFCCHVHFLSSDDAAQQWARTRPDIKVVSVNDAFVVGREQAERLLLASAGAMPPLIHRALGLKLRLRATSDMAVCRGGSRAKHCDRTTPSRPNRRPL